MRASSGTTRGSSTTRATPTVRRSSSSAASSSRHCARFSRAKSSRTIIRTIATTRPGGGKRQRHSIRVIAGSRTVGERSSRRRRRSGRRNRPPRRRNRLKFRVYAPYPRDILGRSGLRSLASAITATRARAATHAGGREATAARYGPPGRPTVAAHGRAGDQSAGGSVLLDEPDGLAGPESLSRCLGLTRSELLAAAGRLLDPRDAGYGRSARERRCRGDVHEQLAGHVAVRVDAGRPKHLSPVE